jgi:hypothetical protein
VTTDVVFHVLSEFYPSSGKPKPAILVATSPVQKLTKQPAKHSCPASPCSPQLVVAKKCKKDDNDDKDEDADKSQSTSEQTTSVSQVLHSGT